jgi:Lar family restriction alleviation protein
MSTELKPRPFCGGTPSAIERPDNIDGTEFFYAVACYCGGYSARAHAMAKRKTPEQAKADAIAAWNRRAATSAHSAREKQPLTDAEALQIHSMSYVRDCLLRYVSRPCDAEANEIVRSIVNAFNGLPVGAAPPNEAQALNHAYAEGRADEREELARICDEEAARTRKEGEGCHDARYDWMAQGIEAVADTFRGIDSATGKPAKEQQ